MSIILDLLGECNESGHCCRVASIRLFQFLVRGEDRL
jgi:hypothetical protein